MRAGGARDATAGSSLIEVLVAVALMGIAFVALLSGLAAAVTSSDVHRSKGLADTHLKSYAELVKADKPYVACGSTSDYALAPAALATSGFTVAVTQVEAWRGDNPATFAASGPGCTPANDTGLQRLTITLTDASGRINPQTTQILKRKT